MPTTRDITWILVTGGGRARVLVQRPTSPRFRTEITFAPDPPRPLAAPTAPLDPRSDGTGAARSDATGAFIADVARRISVAAERRAFNRLVLVAPSAILGALLASLSEHAVGLVLGTLAQDLTALTDEDLAAHLLPWWMPPGGSKSCRAPDQHVS